MSVERNSPAVLAARISVSTLTGALLLLGLIAVVQHYLLQTGLLTFDPGNGFAAQLDRYREHAALEFLHLIPGFVFFTIAPLQFVSPIRRQWPVLHRVLGRIYVVLGLLAGTLGILIAVVFPFGGRLETVLVLPFGAYFLYAVSKGFALARARRITEHRRWMIRGLAAALAISLQRVVLGVLMALVPNADMPFMFSIAIAIGLFFTIGVGELYIRRVPVRTEVRT